MVGNIGGGFVFFDDNRRLNRMSLAVCLYANNITYTAPGDIFCISFVPHYNLQKQKIISSQVCQLTHLL